MLFTPVLLFLGYFATYSLFHTQGSGVDEERVVFDCHANISLLQKDIFTTDTQPISYLNRNRRGGEQSHVENSRVCSTSFFCNIALNIFIHRIHH